MSDKDARNHNTLSSNEANNDNESEEEASA
jgi:hypothetical protein